MIRPCEEYERGAHSENDRCGHTREEPYERSRVERGQHNEQGRMEEEANQPILRPQMTGQARDEQEDVI